MKTKFYIFLTLIFLSTSSIANEQIEDLVNKTYERNYELKSLERLIFVFKEQIALASKLNNPTLQFGANDIWLSDITNRDSEGMQSYFVGISQTFPTNDKLKTKENIARNDYNISKLTLEDKKLQFKANITKYIYTISLLEEKLELYEKLTNNINNLESILTQMYSFNKTIQTDILKTQILKEELKIQNIEIKKLLDLQIINLERITYTDYKSLNINTNLKEIKLKADKKNHPIILTLYENEKKFNNTALFEEQQKYSDISANLSYFERDEKYEDYVNISFAIPLSIYGTEDIKSRQAKYRALEIKNKIQDVEFNFDKQVQTFQTNINNALKTYSSLKYEIIPKLYDIQKNLENYNSFSQINSDAIIKNANEIIKYELQALNEKQKYFDSLSDAIYYVKEIK